MADSIPHAQDGAAEGLWADGGLSSGAFPCEWVEAEDPASATGAANLRVLSLNLLADGLARGSGAPPEAFLPCGLAFEEEGAGGVAYRPGSESCEGGGFRFICSVEALAWPRRWPMLRDMILGLNPDLIGLQEVDLLEDEAEQLSAHDKEIRRDLSLAGYDGTFARKLGRACDGVALFWRRARLRQAGRTETWRLKSVHVALAQPLILDGQWRFTAVATHLKAGLAPEAEQMRFEQAEALLHKLRSHADAVVLADLNSHCWPAAAGKKPEPGQEAQSEQVWLQPRSYPLLAASLSSAYAAVLGTEPCFTCWGGWEDREVRLICDYILLKGGLLRPRRVLQVPDVGDVMRHPERLPNPEHPTDHVPMAADLAVACRPPPGPGAVPYAKRRKPE